MEILKTKNLNKTAKIDLMQIDANFFMVDFNNKFLGITLKNFDTITEANNYFDKITDLKQIGKMIKTNNYNI